MRIGQLHILRTLQYPCFRPSEQNDQQRKPGTSNKAVGGIAPCTKGGGLLH